MNGSADTASAADFASLWELPSLPRLHLDLFCLLYKVGSHRSSTSSRRKCPSKSPKATCTSRSRCLMSAFGETAFAARRTKVCVSRSIRVAVMVRAVGAVGQPACPFASVLGVVVARAAGGRVNASVVMVALTVSYVPLFESSPGCWCRGR